MRLSSMILLAACLYLLWDWARKPGTWAWFAAEPNAAAPAQPNPPSRPGSQPAMEPEPAVPVADTKASPPAPTSSRQAANVAASDDPTDEDPEERTAAAEEFQAITDKTLEIQPEEMFAYGRVVRWVCNQPASAMLKRARADLTFNDFMRSPDRCRGALVELTLNARMVRPCDMVAPDGSELHEVWGFTTASGAWLYDTIVVDLPKGFPAATTIEERVRFVGYFFKLQGYHERGARPNAPPLEAPVLIGRLIWTQPSAPAPTAFHASWGWMILAAFAVLMALQLAWMILRSNRPRSTIRRVGMPTATGPAIDGWFDRAEQLDDHQQPGG
jgi:hypothetical protein